MTREQLTKLIEDIAVDFVLIDPSDAEELTSVISRFKEILAWAGEQSQPVLETALTRMIHMASHELEKSSELSESVYDIMGSSISVIQKHARNDYDFSHALFPREIEDSSTLAPIGQNISTMINTDDQEAREPWIDKNDSPAGLKHPDSLPSHLDMELFAEFLSLQTAILDKMETLILAIEQKQDQKAFAELKRMVHTQKGEAGFLALNDIERLCHGVEDLLESDPSGHHSEMLFSFVDWVRQAYCWYKGEATKPPSEVDDLILAINQTSKERSFSNSRDLAGNGDAGMSMDTIKPEDDATKKTDTLVMKSSIPPKSTGSQIKDSILVDTERLDRIIDMVGELVIAQSMVMQSHEIQTMASQELHRHLSQMDKITRGLQETSLSLRMVPIRSTFQKIARLVRDISKKSGKPIQCIIQGEETELDKTIVDKIGEPLLHIIRNA
ncbi:MAG: Hpt domain-containing protein, partial [Proteobacteria bacterium]|nr:Hpt domain-containing protein [Pseudomonadota bacterium]